MRFASRASRDVEDTLRWLRGSIKTDRAERVADTARRGYGENYANFRVPMGGRADVPSVPRDVGNVCMGIKATAATTEPRI